MAKPNINKVAAHFRAYAEKIAADANAASLKDGITSYSVQVPTDKDEQTIKRNQPANAPARQAKSGDNAAPNVTSADGQGGVSSMKATVPVDPDLAVLEAAQPVDGTPVKSATISQRTANLRAALFKANPSLAPAPTTAAQSTTQKQADNRQEVGTTLDLSQETLIKIAHTILSTDEGIRLTHHLLEKQAGEQAARVQILEAIEAAKAIEDSNRTKQAAFSDVASKVIEIHNSLVQAGVTEEIADTIIKQAAHHEDMLSKLEHPLLKMAYVQGMDDAAMLAAAEQAAGEEGVPPVDEAMPMGGEDLSEEEIMQLLQEMIASGQISEQDIAEALSAVGGAEPAEEAPTEAATAQA